jgi:hypothetical protein
VGVAYMADYQAMSLLKRLFSFNKKNRVQNTWSLLILVCASSLLLAWLVRERAACCYWLAGRVHLAPLVLDRDTVALPLASPSHPQIIGPQRTSTTSYNACMLFNLYTCLVQCSYAYYCYCLCSHSTTIIIRISKNQYA